MLEPGITRYFFSEAYQFLLDQVKNEIEDGGSWLLNVYLWDEWNPAQKIEVLNAAYKLFIRGVYVSSRDINSEEIDAAVAAIVINLKQSLIAEIDDGGDDSLSTYWRKFFLNVFNQVHSCDQQSEFIQETIAAEAGNQNL